SVGNNPTNLTISGVISGSQTFTKVGTGRLIFTSRNFYSSTTTVAGGMLNIRDSQALGSSSSGTTVNFGAALELQIDNLPDSITGTVNTLRVAEPITLNGTGVNNTGALRSVSGINIWGGPITLTGSAGIGVDPDPNRTNSKDYFTNDYSLTVTGDISSAFFFSGNLVKVDGGQLILPNPNSYTGTTDIQQGWITIRDEQALGQTIGGSDTIQPTTTVRSGAALHIKPMLPGASIDLVRNLVLSGTGITHPF